jgi:hypothetical protein
MKLALVVVYLVDEANERLFDVHLSMIERCTTVPFRLYAVTIRCTPRVCEQLAEDPRVRLCPIPPTPLRGTPEHAYYLDELVKEAVRDGSSHVALLHMDSFPVRTSWQNDLAEKLDDSQVLVAIMRSEFGDHKPHPAGMMFRREFYLTHHPTFLLTEPEMASPAYRQYLNDESHTVDSGIGYGYTVHSNGLSWHPLVRSNRAQDHPMIGTIYGDVFFHLGMATRPGEQGAGSLLGRRVWAALRLQPWLHAGVRRAFSPETRAALSKMLPRGFDFVCRDDVYSTVRDRLVQDPHRYLNYLRTGTPLP